LSEQVKLATPPATVAVVPPGLVQVRVELPGLEPKAKVTVVVLSPISTLPSASSTDTPTEKLAPAAELAGGWVVNTSFEGVPTASTLAVVAPAETVTGLEVSSGASGELVEPPHVGSNSTL
jgi:hypothetical protein